VAIQPPLTVSVKMNSSAVWTRTVK